MGTSQKNEPPPNLANSADSTPIETSAKSISISTEDNPCIDQKTVWTPPESLEWVDASDGSPSDVVNLYVHGSIDALRDALLDAGWTQAFPRNIGVDLLYAVSVGLDVIPVAINWASRQVQKLIIDLFHTQGKPKNLPNPVDYLIQRMPVAPEDLCGRPSAFAFEMNNNPIGGRDHFRVYSLPEKDAQGVTVWAIAASRDERIIFDIHRPASFFMNHEPQPNEDFERDYVLDALESMKVVEKVETIQLKPTVVHPENGAFSGDDRVYDVTLTH